MNPGEPLVSILTPVYNGETYLRECIESVLHQAYSNWDYTIVNNCSKDGTADIANEYVKQDTRIHLSDNSTFLPIIANHNRAFGLIAPTAKYCKIVSADDWLFPECIARMVSVAEAHPSVGFVGSYQLSGGGDQWYVRNYGLSYAESFVGGREVCRRHLLGPRPLDVFGNPTSTLYRADLIRRTEAFYPNATAEADRSACFLYLGSADYGFVHQVLSYERLHEARITTVSKGVNAYLSSQINDSLIYGKLHLSPTEQQHCVQELLNEYYRFLASCIITAGPPFRSRSKKEFWDYHRARLSQLGFPLSSLRLSRAVVIKLLMIMSNPTHYLSKWRKGLVPAT